MNDKYSSQRFDLIKGVVSELQVRQSEEDFVFSNADKTAGGMAAAGLAVGGLAGTATGALMSSGDTADKVSVFVCKVGHQIVNGRFGEVTFANGDEVEVAGAWRGNCMNAHAVVRPIDRTIWMHPHCGRGAKAYRRNVWNGTTWSSIGTSTLMVALNLSFFDRVRDAPIWFWLTAWMIGILSVGCICIFVAGKFSSFSLLSSEIFAALRFDNPDEVDLPKQQKITLKNATNDERLAYHPHTRWVYKY